MSGSSRLAVLCFLFVLASTPLAAGDVEGNIREAEKLAEGGDYAGAMALLEKTVAENPEDSDAMATLGLYTGMGAGQTSDFSEAGRLMMLSFERLDKAVKLDPENPTAYFYRGILGIKVPGFLGRLDAGVDDLEKAVELYSSGESEESKKGRVAAMEMLAEGYGLQEDAEAQKRTLAMIVELAPGTAAAEKAQKQLDGMTGTTAKENADTGVLLPREGDSEEVLAMKKSLEGDPENTSLLLGLGGLYFEEGSYENARDVMKVYVSIDQTSSDAYRLLGIYTARSTEHGYDDQIYEDTDNRSKLAFEAMAALDKAVDLDPDNMDTRCMRGVFGLLMPFFLGKHDQSVKDLEMVLESGANDSLKSEALFHLGYAKEREALRNYIELAKKYPDSEGARLAFDRQVPKVARLDESELDKPCVKIDFILGFQDELPPQTAVWIEDEDENHIRTLYVSGFAGYVKERQITLPLWAAVTGFEGVDGVTSASIDIGHHIYVWDLKDYDGKKVKKGKYRVRVETSHWPTNLYQNVETLIEVGGKRNSVRVEEGVFIPFLEVTYIK